MGQVSLAAGSGSAIHSCTWLAASPALLLMPLHSLVRTSNGIRFAWLQMLWGHPSRPACCDKQGVVLHGLWGFSLVGVQGGGWQSCPLCPSSATSTRVSARGLGAESGSAGAAARQRCWCQPAWPAHVPAARREQGQRTGARSSARQGWKQVQQQEIYPGRRK